MNNIELGLPIPSELIGAYQCSVSDVDSKPNRILVINSFSTIQTALINARRIEAYCKETYPGKCNSNCPISQKIEELTNLNLTTQASIIGPIIRKIRSSIK
ncbi:MAG: hypothetical protein Q7T59_02395 [Candidatus Woesebacteria bacterium]|nr:hypothetical protein [Candidatus Woesebacteria bacterium]